MYSTISSIQPSVVACADRRAAALDFHPARAAAPQLTARTRIITRSQTTNRHESERHALLAARAFIDDMRARYRELERQTGASITVHRALACIAAEPGISASRLAGALGMKKSAVSHMLKGLADRDWIERIRTATDQRAVKLYLTESGRKIVQATGGKAAGTLQRAISRLSDAQINALSAGLEALVRHLPPFPRPSPRRTRREH